MASRILMPTMLAANCHWCGEGLSSTIQLETEDRQRRTPGVFTFYACPACGSWSLHPLPPDDQTHALYEQHYLFELLPWTRSSGAWNVLWNRLEWRLFYRPWHQRDAKHLRRLLGPDPIRLLDVGCGTGLKLKVFREQGIDAEGIERSSRAVQYATTVLGVPVRAESLDTLHDRGEQFDVVTLYSVLEHTAQPRPFIRAVFRLIRPGGFLVIRVPVQDAFLFRLFGRRHCAYGEAPRHAWIPSARGLIQGLEREGARLVGQAPTGLLISAANFAMSLYPTSRPPLAATQGAASHLASRLAACLLVAAGLPFALRERLEGRTSDMDFFFQVKTP